VLPLINAYNKALSEKANDVDYFADAYLKVLGQKLDEEAVKYLRESRVINFDGDAQGLVVDFMQKPNGDDTQEHLLDRIERLIFIIAMVANISDENFATSSGIALRYKLLAMTNLAKKKERKFTSGMNRRYKLIFSNPVVQLPSDAWITIKYQFTPNIPNNIAEEAATAQSLAGITSKKTQLSVLSVVDDVNAEIDQINKEMDEMQTEYNLERLNDETNAEDREDN
jgi:SPP1 family phage portal protein